jgi:hypothetical protein
MHPLCASLAGLASGVYVMLTTTCMGAWFLRPLVSSCKLLIYCSLESDLAVVVRALEKGRSEASSIGAGSPSETSQM